MNKSKKEKIIIEEVKLPCINCGFLTNDDFLCGGCGNYLCESCSDDICNYCKEGENEV